MVNIRRMIQEGYKSLAKRTLGVCDSFIPTLPRQMPEVQREFETYRQILEQISQTGDVKERGDTANKNFHNMIGLFEQAIPIGLKPQNPTMAIAFATSAIRAYDRISSLEELLKRTNISELNISPDGGGIALTDSGEGGNPKRVLFVQYNPVMPAHSAIINIHEFRHGLQPEMQQIYDTLFGLLDIKGFPALMKSVYKIPELEQKMSAIAIATHQLHFLDLEEVKEVAKRVGVDMSKFNEYLRENIPKMDFLACYSEGDAYLTQTDIIKSMPDFQGIGVHLQAYELLSLTDALVAPFQIPKDKVYELGIGLVEYFRNNPSQTGDLKNSVTFHQQVSEKLRELGR